MTMPFETPAAQVRTGHVIKVAVDGFRQALEVDVVHHETHVVDGERVPVVRFTGWADGDVYVERGWGQLPDTRVLVCEDRRGYSYLTVDGRPGDF
jgi:hypothetical protein